MSKGKNATTKPSPEDAVLAAVEANPGATTEGIGGSADVARSTASKALARLADAGKVVRHEGGREKGKRLPDRWIVSGAETPAAYAAHVKTQAGAEGKATRAAASKPAGKAGAKPAAAKAAPSVAKGKPAAGKGGAPKASNAGKGEQPEAQQERLKAFGLDPLVLAYVEEHTDSGPHGPAAVAKAIERSSGAVANCMKRLAEKDKLRLVSDKPLRYDKIAA
jgi:hypothetical protein